VRSPVLPVAVGAAALAVAVGGAVPVEAATVYCYGFQTTIVGTSGADTIDAADGVTDGRDVINGLGATTSSPGLAATTSSVAASARTQSPVAPAPTRSPATRATMPSGARVRR
jgi:hypothetical protein